MPLSPSELIINPDGSIYHLNLHPEDVADIIITVGDPERVHRIAQHMSRKYVEKRKREFYTVTGLIQGEMVTVIGTGIGTDNVDIVISEIDALVNIDFKKRQIREKLRKLIFCRIGTSGALREEIPLDSMVVSRAAIGMEGLMHYYHFKENDSEEGLIAFVNQVLGSDFSGIQPYAVFSPWSHWNILPGHFKQGITLTAGGFYGPQSRRLRLQPKYPALLDKIQTISWEGLNVTNMEMETSAIYGMCSLLGHDALSFNAIIANRITKTFSKNSKKTVDDLIENVLDFLIKVK